MNPTLFRFSVLTVLTLMLWSGVGHASSSVSDSVHYCVPFDYEQWRRENPRPAAKRTADLNIGEPRTVRMIYFLPNDRSYRQEVVDSMKVVIRQVQTFYAEQMEAHGYGNRTFSFENDAQGEPMVRRVDGQHPDLHYFKDTKSLVDDELAPTFDYAANVYLILVDNSGGQIGQSPDEVPYARGIGSRVEKVGGFVYVTSAFDAVLVGHEIGHAFGLQHDFSDPAYIMSYGPGQTRLSACHAEFLAVHPYFNPDIPIEQASPPTITVASPLTYPPGSLSVPIRVEVGDTDGVHQVLLIYRSWEFHACRGLKGEGNAVVEFDFRGSTYNRDGSTLIDEPTQPIRIIAVDTRGNTSHYWFSIVRTSPEQIGTLEGHTSRANSVSFSPDGTTLASGSSDATIKLWDTATRTEIATLEGHTGGANSVSFSPDGTTLASGSSDATIKLWDTATRTEIATLEGHTGGANSVSFSPDGTTLASGSSDATIKLWDVATRTAVATLEGHTDRVTSVSFSPDGGKLASGAYDGTVRLWDVATRTEVATLEGHPRNVASVVFSPDGATLASASGDNSVRLWDVATRLPTAALEFQCGGWQSLAFSPGGAILAAGAGNAAVYLWDVRTRERIATLTGHTGPVYSAVFSSDGTTLAAGSWDKTVNLWDTSQWTRRRPFSLEIISGGGQHGTPGSVLAQPLVVIVKDQHGNPLPDASVTFTVTGGDGRLSGQYTAQHVISDASGRAAIPLTLGPRPGTYTVGVFIGSEELATFQAEGVETAVTVLKGDYVAWHLPDGAGARLGKGTIGFGDRAVALSPDGRTLAVASNIGVWLYEVATARALSLLPSSLVNAVAFSAGGILAAGSASGEVELWEVETGDRIGTLRHGTAVYGLAFSPDGTVLASGSDDQVIRVWEVATRRQVATWEVPRDGYSVYSLSELAFSPDGSRLVSGFQDGTVRLWDVATRTEIATLQGHTKPVTSVAYSPKGGHLASAGAQWDGTVILWDVATRSPIATLENPGRWDQSVVFSPDGAILATGSFDGAIVLWDVATQDRLALIEGQKEVSSMAFSPDGATLASAGTRDGTVRLRDIETENTATLYGYASLNSMALSRDGTILATVSRNSQVTLWNPSTHSRIVTLSWDASFTAPFSLRSVAFSPDGGTLAAGSYRRLHLWDLATRAEIATLREHNGWVNSVAFSPDGALVATAGGWAEGGVDGTVRLWDAATRSVVAVLQGHTDEVNSVAFSLDGALASGSKDGTVRLWDVGTRSEVATFDGHTVGVNSVAFSPDGNTLASGATNGRIRLWDVASRTQVATLEGNEGNRNYGVYSVPFPNSVAFSPDGNTLASGATNGRIRLWDVASRTQVATLKGHSNVVNSVAFSPDGMTLFSGSRDGTMLQWDIAPYITPPFSTTDFDGDGNVGFSDFLKFAAQFGLSQGDTGYDARFDLDGNGTVGFSDFLIFASSFGQ